MSCHPLSPVFCFSSLLLPQVKASASPSIATYTPCLHCHRPRLPIVLRLPYYRSPFSCSPYSLCSLYSILYTLLRSPFSSLPSLRALCPSLSSLLFYLVCCMRRTRLPVSSHQHCVSLCARQPIPPSAVLKAKKGRQSVRMRTTVTAALLQLTAYSLPVANQRLDALLVALVLSAL